ncbi:MAG: hypothetical protein AAB263_03610 [Planctomycetota bacterium]
MSRPPFRSKLSRRDGFNLYTLENDHVSLEIVPELGGKMSSLRCVPSGREWLWAPTAERRLHASPTPNDFLRSSLIGADECIPTIAASTVGDRSYPDHGEAWSRPWTIDRQAWSNEGTIVTTVLLPTSEARFTRTVSLDGEIVRLSYQAHNLSSARPWQFIYSFHPLLAPQPGDVIVLPAEVSRVHVENWDGAIAMWPQIVPGARADHLDVSGITPATLKMTTADPLLEPTARVVNSVTGDQLRFDCDDPLITALGIYINRAGWGGHHHFAIEPTNARADALAVCLDRRLGGQVLDPGASVAWSFSLRVSQG